MPNLRVPILLLTLAIAGSTGLMAAEPDGFTDILKPVFDQNCIKCHGQKGKKVKGKVNLLKLRGASDLTGSGA